MATEKTKEELERELETLRESYEELEQAFDMVRDDLMQRKKQAARQNFNLGMIAFMQALEDIGYENTTQAIRFHLQEAERLMMAVLNSLDYDA